MGGPLVFCGIFAAMAKADAKAPDAGEPVGQAQVNQPPAGFLNQQQQATTTAQAPAPTMHRAVVVENSDGVAFRAPVGVHVKDLGDIVHGAFHGVLEEGEKKTVWRVLHGTPIRGIPGRILDQIHTSDQTAIGPYQAPPANQPR